MKLEHQSPDRSRFLPQRHFQALMAAVVQLKRIAITRSSSVTQMAIQAAYLSPMS